MEQPDGREKALRHEAAMPTLEALLQEREWDYTYGFHFEYAMSADLTKWYESVYVIRPPVYMQACKG